LERVTFSYKCNQQSKSPTPTYISERRIMKQIRSLLIISCGINSELGRIKSIGHWGIYDVMVISSVIIGIRMRKTFKLGVMIDVLSTSH
jgi:hypothetical protein